MKRNRWKGHCYLCQGYRTDKRKPSLSTPVSVLRQLGRTRRLSTPERFDRGED